MKMKLLDYTLVSLLAGMATMASAEEAVTAQAAAGTGGNTAQAAPMDCTDSGCTSGEGFLFKLRTRGERKPAVKAGPEASSETLAPDRRVTIAVEQPGKAVAKGKFSVQLANGGVIWATEDPALGETELTVSAPSIIPFDGTAITKPVQFYTRSNYSEFVKRYELSIYRATDADLIDPITVLPLEVGSIVNTEWDGALPSKYHFRAGDELVYVLRA
ncbi:MAG: hypothetical protein EOO79_12255, partial [Oxalobacteraceae bacterium]